MTQLTMAQNPGRVQREDVRFVAIALFWEVAVIIKI